MGEIKRVLITGGMGFIGRRLAERLLHIGYEVVLFDSLTPQVHGALPAADDIRSLATNPKLQLIRADLCDRENVKTSLENTDAVVHLAAETGTAQSMYEIARYTNANLGGTAVLLDVLANSRHSVRKILLASSRSVYGEGAYLCRSCGIVYPSARTEAQLKAAQWEPSCPRCAGAINPCATAEDAQTSPASIYAATKLGQEMLVKIACEALGIASITLRLQNVYGEGQSLRNPYTGILSIFSNRIRQGKLIRAFEDGHESRDFVHVSDVVQAFVLALSSPAADGMTLNVGSGQLTSVLTIARLLSAMFTVSAEPVISGQFRIGDIRHCYGDISRIAAKLGYAPAVPLERGLERFVEWVKTQPVEADALDQANEQLISRGLMSASVGQC